MGVIGGERGIRTPGEIAPTSDYLSDEDSKSAGAEVVVIGTRTLPSGVEHLAQMGDVWVTGHRISFTRSEE